MAALDFPNSPTTNQLFTAPNGVIYQWTGTLWQAYGTTGLVNVGAAPTFDSTSAFLLDNSAGYNITGSTPMTSGQGTQIFSRVFTANNPANPIQVSVTSVVGGGNAGTCCLALFVDGVSVAQQGGVYNTSWGLPVSLYWQGVLSAGAHTFMLRFVGTTGLYINGANGTPYQLQKTTMVISEVAQAAAGPAGVQGPPGVMPVGTVNPQTGTAYTLQSSDINGTVTMNNAATNTVTIPSGLGGAGAYTQIIQIGAGQTVVAAGSGVTLNGAYGLTCRAQWSSVGVLAYAANGFVLSGDSAP